MADLRLRGRSPISDIGDGDRLCGNVSEATHLKPIEAHAAKKPDPHRFLCSGVKLTFWMHDGAVSRLFSRSRVCFAPKATSHRVAADVAKCHLRKSPDGLTSSRGQLVQQHLRLLRVARVETLREPPVNRSEQFARLQHLALVTPEACEREPVRWCSITISVFDQLGEKS